jgi:hypothetical protein
MAKPPYLANNSFFSFFAFAKGYAPTTRCTIPIALPFPAMIEAWRAGRAFSCIAGTSRPSVRLSNASGCLCMTILREFSAEGAVGAAAVLASAQSPSA